MKCFTVQGDESSKRSPSPGGTQAEIKEKSNELSLTELSSGRLYGTVCHSKRAFVLSTGEEIFVWLGRDAITRVRTTAWLLAQGLHKRLGMPYFAPILRVGEGLESQYLLATLGRGLLLDPSQPKYVKGSPLKTRARPGSDIPEVLRAGPGIPCAKKTVVEGRGIEQYGAKGLPCYFEIFVRDSSGYAVGSHDPVGSTPISDFLRVLLLSHDSNTEQYAELSFMGDGRFGATVSPKVVGPHMIYVLVYEATADGERCMWKHAERGTFPL